MSVQPAAPDDLFHCLNQSKIVTAQSIADLNSGPPPTPGPKVYRALLSQSGTDAPVARVLENTLGGPVTFAYNGVGDYNINSTGLFTLNKTMVFYTGDDFNGIASTGLIGQVDANSFELFTGTLTNTGFNATEMGGGSCSLEILVYP